MTKRGRLNRISPVLTGSCHAPSNQEAVMTDTMRQFARTIRVQAIQYTGPGPASTTREIIQWAHAGRPPEFGAIVVDHGTYLSVILHGIPMEAMPGDWIIRDANGEVFPCQDR